MIVTDAPDTRDSYGVKHTSVFRSKLPSRVLCFLCPMLFVSLFRCIFSFKGILREGTLSIFCLLKSKIRDTSSLVFLVLLRDTTSRYSLQKKKNNAHTKDPSREGGKSFQKEGCVETKDTSTYLFLVVVFT